MQRVWREIYSKDRDISMIYEVHSTIIFPGSWVSDFAGNSRRTKTQQGKDKASKHNGTYSTIHGNQKEVVSTTYYNFYFTFYLCSFPPFAPLRGSYQPLLLPHSAAEIPCPIRPVKTPSPLPWSCVWYAGWSAYLLDPILRETETDPLEPPFRHCCSTE